MYNHLLLHVQGRLVLAGDGGDVQVPARLYGHSFPSKQLETKEGGGLADLQGCGVSIPRVLE